MSRQFLQENDVAKGAKVFTKVQVETTHSPSLSQVFTSVQVTFENLFEFLSFFVWRSWVCLSKHLWELVNRIRLALD